MSGVWFRQVPASGEPLLRPDPAPDGRWQHGETVEGLYLADSEQTAWAEWYRALGELGIPPEQGLPRELWSFAVDLDRIADLSDVQRLEAVGLPIPKPSRRQWQAFQAVGEQLHAQGWAGVLYPSAALAAGRALCVFREHDEIEGVTTDKLQARYNALPPDPVG